MGSYEAIAPDEGPVGTLLKGCYLRFAAGERRLGMFASVKEYLGEVYSDGGSSKIPRQGRYWIPRKSPKLSGRVYDRDCVSGRRGKRMRENKEKQRCFFVHLFPLRSERAAPQQCFGNSSFCLAAVGAASMRLRYWRLRWKWGLLGARSVSIASRGKR